jgi:arylsulfatase A-like enzyme
LGWFIHYQVARKLQFTSSTKMPLNKIPKNSPILAEVLRRMGYHTFGLAANINIGKPMGFNRGFDRFNLDSEASAEDLYNMVNSWKDRIQKNQPYFLYLHFNDPHEPYIARDPYYEPQTDLVDDQRARYISEIHFADDHIARIYEEFGLNQNTLVIVVTDHGEEFMEHGRVGHLQTLYDELNRVMILFHGPSLGIVPQRCPVNVSLLDVAPTLFDFLGRGRVSGQMGISLLPLIQGDPEATGLVEQLEKRILFAHRVGEDVEQSVWGAIHKHWKLIENCDGSRQLFNHRTDPREKKDVFAEGPAILDQLGEALNVFKMLKPSQAFEQIEMEIDPKLAEKLRSIGYAD